MRHLLIAAAAVSIGGLMASSAFADMLFMPGGPKQIGNMCRITTDDFGNDTFGYWTPCPQQARAQAQAPAPRVVKPVKRTHVQY